MSGSPESPRKSRASWLPTERALHPGLPLLLQPAGRAVRQPVPAADAGPGHDRAMPRLVRLRLGDPQGRRRPPLHGDEHHVPHSKRGELVSPEEVPHSRDKQALPRGQGDRQPGWREDHRLSPTPGPRALSLGQAGSPCQARVHLVVLLVPGQGRGSVQSRALVLNSGGTGRPPSFGEPPE